MESSVASANALTFLQENDSVTLVLRQYFGVIYFENVAAK